MRRRYSGSGGKRNRTAKNCSRPDFSQHDMMNYPVDLAVSSADFVYGSERMALVSRLTLLKLQRTTHVARSPDALFHERDHQSFALL